jgi:peroxiredoxin
MRPSFSRPTVLLTAALVLALGGRAAADNPTKARLNQKIANVTFRDAAGKASALYDLKGKKAIVLVFLSFDCPVSTSYSQPLADMANAYGKQGITFIGLTVNQDETPAQIAKHGRDFNLPFPVYLDRKLAAAEALKAEFTPEAFILDGDFALRYRGRIDNSYYARLKKNQQVTTQDLNQALTEIISGRKVSVQATEAIGCAIPREERAPAREGAVTYHRDVLPILQKNCQGCHRPGEVGPFSLLTYKQAVNWASDIKDYTQRRLMPPWKIAEGGPFHNERKLSDKDLATLAAWVDGNTPEGDPKDAPPPAQFPEGWQLGKPDLVLTVPADFQVGPNGRDVFRCFVLPTHLTEDRHVVALEVRPGNARIVHHALLFFDTSGGARKMEAKERVKPRNEDDPHGPADLDKGPGYSTRMGIGITPRGGLGGWAPGQMARNLPEGTGILLPKGSDIVMQVHYHRNGRLEKDRTSIGLYFAKKPVKQEYQGGVLSGGVFFSIPAGAERHPLKRKSWAKGDFTLYSIMPHMHLLGKEIKVTVTPPEGPAKTLLAIKQWDYNWQETYYFKEPVRIKAGSRLDVEAIYDNSARNANNPFDPPRRVGFGEQTTDEMCFVFLGGVSDLPGQSLPLSFLPIARPKTAKQAE